MWAKGVRELFKQNPENVIVHYDFYPGEEVRVMTEKIPNTKKKEK